MSTDRTDTDRLNWLIAEGYIVELRCYSDGTWTLETDDDLAAGPTARKAIDAAMDAEAQ